MLECLRVLAWGDGGHSAAAQLVACGAMVRLVEANKVHPHPIAKLQLCEKITLLPIHKTKQESRSDVLSLYE